MTPKEQADARGLLIAIEGIDGAGKSTQARLLRDRFVEAGHTVAFLREPTTGPVGMELRALAAKGREFLTPQREFELFLADREYDVRENIAPALRRGEVVILDRYYISSMAYQGAAGLNPEEIRAANERIAPVPDALVLFDLPVAEALRRIRNRDAQGPNLFEREDFLHRVREIFDSLGGFPYVVRVDATRDEGTVHGAIWAGLRPVVEEWEEGRR